jgi:LacI family transcriptional regulator
MARKRTIADIAQLAGVSKATVSRVLNHKPDVDPSTRERILRIMEDVGFVPSITASGLAGGRSRLIGLLVPSFTWPLIPDIVRGVAEVAGNTIYEIVLYSLNDKTREDHKGDVIDHILSTNLIAGLLAILPGQSSRYIVRLHQLGFPVVMIDDQALPPAMPWVGADNFTGAYDAVRHLLHLGHRRIAHIQGPLRFLCSRERYRGYCQALQEVGIPVDPALVIEGDFEIAGGESAAYTLLTLPPAQRPTAIFAGSDQMAFGTLAAAIELGLRVPDDLALVGFDDIYSSAHIQPPLTTVKQPFCEMGQRAAALLLSLLDRASQQFGSTYPYPYPTFKQVKSETTLPTDERESDEPIRIFLSTSLVVRASCGSGLRAKAPPTV